jgi:hypothetical protein
MTGVKLILGDIVNTVRSSKHSALGKVNKLGGGGGVRWQ